MSQFMRDALVPYLVIVVIGPILIAFLWFVIWFFVRWELVSERRTRSEWKRLRDPHLEELEAEWSITLPDELAGFYRTSEVIDRCEFYFVPPGVERPRWFIMGFYPLTRVFAAELIKLTGLPGIPIANDGDNKAEYYLPFASLRQGAVPVVVRRESGGKDIEVAPLSEFLQFRVVEPRDDDED
jgi:hypothetical protein